MALQGVVFRSAYALWARDLEGRLPTPTKSRVCEMGDGTPGVEILRQRNPSALPEVCCPRASAMEGPTLLGLGGTRDSREKRVGAGTRVRICKA